MDVVAAELARRHDWIVVVGTGEGADELAEGRRRGRDLLAFRRGLAALPAPVDIFVKVDADTSFDPDYYTQLLAHFADDDKLGIAGGCCYELVDARWERIKVAGSHPRGASRAYRWALLDVVESLEPELGWDGVDEVMAELRGYRTAGFQEFGFRHHRKVGEREGRLRAGSALGRQAWYMGYRPTYLLLRARLPGARERGVARDGVGLRDRGGHRRTPVPAPARHRPDPREPAPPRGHASGPMDIRPEV